MPSSAEIEALGARAAFAPAELTDAGAPDAMFDATLAAFGRVDGLVNAGAMTDRASVAEGSMAMWEALFAANARAPFFLMQRLVDHLRERKAPGSIVNILSINVHGGLPSLAIYSAAKAALALLTKNAAFAHRFDRIRINGINVGWTDTPAERQMQAVTLGLGEGWLAKANAEAPFGRLLVPDDIARLALFPPRRCILPDDRLDHRSGAGARRPEGLTCDLCRTAPRRTRHRAAVAGMQRPSHDLSGNCCAARRASSARGHSASTCRSARAAPAPAGSGDPARSSPPCGRGR